MENSYSAYRLPFRPEPTSSISISSRPRTTVSRISQDIDPLFRYLIPYCSLRCCTPRCLHWTAFALLPTKKRLCRRGSYAVPLLLRQWPALASSSGGNCASQTWRVHSHVPPRHAAYYSSLTSSPWTLCKALLHSTGGSLGTTAMMIAVLHRTPRVLSLTYMSIRAYLPEIVPQDLSSLGT